MSKKIRILLADDRALVRAGLRALLEKSPDLEIVAEAVNSHELLRMAKTRWPDVVVMDAALPNGNGLQATVRLHERNSRIPVVLLSTTANGERASQAFKASASGFLLMKAKPRELGMAIRRVVRGRRYLDSSLAGAPRTAGVPCESSLPSSTALSPRRGTAVPRHRRPGTASFGNRILCPAPQRTQGCGRRNPTGADLLRHAAHATFGVWSPATADAFDDCPARPGSRGTGR